MVRALASLSLATLIGCAAPPEVKREDGVLLQFDLSPAADGDAKQQQRTLKLTWQALLADMEADAATQQLLQELFSGLPVRLVVAEGGAPELLEAPPKEEGALLLRVAERAPPQIAPLGTGWQRCVLAVDLARVGSLRRETPKKGSELVYDGEAGALKLAVEAFLRGKLRGWSFGATPRRTTVAQRVEAYKQRNAWRRAE